MSRDTVRVRAHTWRMVPEQRRHARERLALPLEVAGRVAVTRDISVGGLFLMLEGEHELHGRVEFELLLAGFSMKFTASGEIVRVEHAAGTTGIAVRLTTPRLARVDCTR
jgi:hypothetical protein